METRANHVVIGLFALAVLAAGLSFIYWVAEIGDNQQRAEIIFEFNGPVNGLSAGSPVLFNGIQVGEVQTLSLNPNNPQEALALAEVDLETPVRSDTSASLGITGITGTAFIALRGGSMEEVPLLNPNQPVIITAENSAVQNFLDGTQTILARANNAMGTVERFLEVNEPFLSATIQDINAITSSFAEQSDSIETLMLGIGAIATEITGLSGRLEGIIAASEELLLAVEPGAVSEIVENVRQASTEFRGIGEDARGLVARGDVIFDGLEESTDSLASSMALVEEVVSAVNTQQIRQMVGNVEMFSAALPDTTERLDRVLEQAETIAGQAEVIANDVSTFTAALPANAERLDTIFANAESFSAGLEGSSVSLQAAIADVEQLVAAINADEVGQAVSDFSTFASTLPETGRQVTSVLNRAEVATDNVTRFTDSLGDNAESLDQIFADAVLVADRLERASQQIDQLFTRFDGFLGEGDATGLIADAQGAAVAIRNVAQAFEGRSATIADGLARFSGRGLQDVEALVSEGRRVLSRIDRVVSSLERNPQQLIFGEGAAPEYQPQRR